MPGCAVLSIDRRVLTPKTRIPERWSVQGWGRRVATLNAVSPKAQKKNTRLGRWREMLVGPAEGGPAEAGPAEVSSGGPAKATTNTSKNSTDNSNSSTNSKTENAATSKNNAKSNKNGTNSNNSSNKQHYKQQQQNQHQQNQQQKQQNRHKDHKGKKKHPTRTKILKMCAFWARELLSIICQCSVFFNPFSLVPKYNFQI